VSRSPHTRPSDCTLPHPAAGKSAGGGRVSRGCLAGSAWASRGWCRGGLVGQGGECFGDGCALLDLCTCGLHKQSEHGLAGVLVCDHSQGCTNVSATAAVCVKVDQADGHEAHTSSCGQRAATVMPAGWSMRCWWSSGWLAPRLHLCPVVGCCAPHAGSEARLQLSASMWASSAAITCLPMNCWRAAVAAAHSVMVSTWFGVLIAVWLPSDAVRPCLPQWGQGNVIAGIRRGGVLCRRRCGVVRLLSRC
jgi:hypothetical protein